MKMLKIIIIIKIKITSRCYLVTKIIKCWLLIKIRCCSHIKIIKLWLLVTRLIIWLNCNILFNPPNNNSHNKTTKLICFNNNNKNVKLLYYMKKKQEIRWGENILLNFTYFIFI